MVSRQAWGAARAARLWRRLQPCALDDGHIPHGHPHYCGHGLVRSPAGVRLCEIEDGVAHYRPSLAEWSDEASCVAVFARQSDWSCAGWDPGETLFFTTDRRARGNQRLRMAELDGFCRSPVQDQSGSGS